MKHVIYLACILLMVTISKQALIRYGKDVGDYNILTGEGASQKFTLQKNFKFGDKDFNDFYVSLFFLH